MMNIMVPPIGESSDDEGRHCGCDELDDESGWRGREGELRSRNKRVDDCGGVVVDEMRVDYRRIYAVRCNSTQEVAQKLGQ